MPSVAAGFFRSVVIWRGAQYPAISDPFATERKRLFDHLAKAVGEGPTLKAMRRIPRENFVPPSSRNKAYLNIALPIGKGQTISQPQMVALAADALELRGDEYVLEVGAGSGYQAAVIAELAPFGSVLAVERIPELLARGAPEPRRVRDCQRIGAAGGSHPGRAGPGPVRRHPGLGGRAAGAGGAARSTETRRATGGAGRKF